MSAPDPLAVMRSRAYLGALALAVVLGVPIAAAAFGFLKLIALVQGWVFSDLPHSLGYGEAPVWWPLLPLAAAGLLVGLTVRYLPGHGGGKPTGGVGGGRIAPRPGPPRLRPAGLPPPRPGAPRGPGVPPIP